jgi:hypothetical protein
MCDAPNTTLIWRGQSHHAFCAVRRGCLLHWSEYNRTALFPDINKFSAVRCGIFRSAPLKRGAAANTALYEVCYNLFPSFFHAE